MHAPVAVAVSKTSSRSAQASARLMSVSVLERPSTAPAKVSTERHAPRGPPAPPGQAAAIARYTQASSLVPLLAPRGLEPAPVRLLRSGFIERRAAALSSAQSDEERRVLALPRRQDLEALEAAGEPVFMSLEEALHGEGRRRQRSNFNMQFFEPCIVSISHCQLSADHPDPLGLQLLSLVEAVRTERRRTDRHDFPAASGGDYAVFYSWCSLYQPDPELAERPAAEAKAHAAAMADIDLWYAHKFTRLVVLDIPVRCASSCEPRSTRGWPAFELAVHSLSKQLVHGPRTPRPLFPGPCAPYAPAPRTAGAFAEQLSTLTFEDEVDRAQLVRIYAATLERLLLIAEHLHFGGLGWGDEECACLAELLPLCRHAKSLNLSRNPISDVGIEAIAKALIAPRSAPRLREINLQRIPYGPGGIIALQEVSRERDIVWFV